MAYVPLTAAALTLQGRSGKMYNLPFTKATAVGFCSFTQDGQTFYNLPEDCRLVDSYLGDAPNATDYVDVYLNGLQKIQMRLFIAGIKAATTVPRIPPSSWIHGGTQVSLYHYSA